MAPGTVYRLPSERQARYYALISRYPGAYKQGSKRISAKSLFPCPVFAAKCTRGSAGPHNVALGRATGF